MRPFDEMHQLSIIGKHLICGSQWGRCIEKWRYEYMNQTVTHRDEMRWAFNGIDAGDQVVVFSNQKTKPGRKKDASENGGA